MDKTEVRLNEYEIQSRPVKSQLFNIRHLALR